MSTIVCLLLSWIVAAAAAVTLDDAIRLQQDGKNREAQQALSAIIPALRTSGDRASLARALAAATDASLALGDYDAALGHAREAFDVHERLGQHGEAAWDLNATGLANQYLGRYDAALDAFRRALDLDRASRQGDGEITRLNNIGTVHFLQGRYSDALLMYQDALGAVDARATDRSRGRLRKMTVSNLAALNQRLGADERALDLYAQLGAGETMLPSEEAQLLVNQGALNRRLGDPKKALDLYRAAQRLFASEAHRDGEIGAWRNIGIVWALDLHDNARALDAFDTALRLARDSSNRRGETQALLYRGEVLRRMGRFPDAARDLREALDAATAAGLVEEQWKALYGIGLTASAQQDRAGARAALERAIATIESVRADLRTTALRSEFLADKRDVYDALIWLRLAERPVPTDDVLRLFEQSRARTWQDRLHPHAPPPPIAAVQAALPAGTMLLEYWIGDAGMARLSISRAASDVVVRPATEEDASAIRRITDAVAHAGAEWRTASASAGRILFSGLQLSSDVEHVVIVPDGRLQFVPFEALALPDSGQLAIERVDVTYAPAAGSVVRRSQPADRRWRWPWQRQLVAFADPSPDAPQPLEPRPFPPLPYAREEVERVAGELRGRADLHVGADAQKRFVTAGDLRTVPLVHFSTHAVADTRDPDRSRILLASPRPGTPAAYLFLREINDLDLRGVRLVTLSACDTERGTIIRGEGVEGFSRALLAAGARSAVTTLWEIGDQTAAEFMAQFYYGLSHGRPPAAALRDAKVQFAHAQTAWAHPHYWAAYILTGDGGTALPRVVPWSALIFFVLFVLVAISAWYRAATSPARSSSLRRTAD